MKPNERIKARREELGLTDVEVANKVGLSIHDYGDIEIQVNEVFLYPELKYVKRICEVLKFDFFELFHMHCLFCEEDKQYLDDYSLPRNELIRKRRTEMGFSASELADRAGFEELAIDLMEKDGDYLETWPIEYIEDLSKILDIPLQVLLGIKCKKCGHKKSEIET